MPQQLIIGCLDVFVPTVQAVITQVAEPEFVVNFATSLDANEQERIVSGADFILVGPAPVSARLISHCSSVRLIQKYGTGVDRFDVDAATAARIPVAIAAGANAAPVSELALALMIAVGRRLTYNDRLTRRGEWPRDEMRGTCYQLDGKTVGLLGFGAIAQLTARRLAGFDVRVLYHARRRASLEQETALRASHVTLEHLLENSDILSLHAPLTSETRHLIDESALRRMKRGAILVNTARGELVDEEALLRALKDGHLRGAGLDVFSSEPPAPSHPLFALDNVVATSHIGGGVFDNVVRVMGHAIGNMRRVLRGEALALADVIVAAPMARPQDSREAPDH